MVPSGQSAFVGGAAPSMFGLRWINAASYKWHRRPDCPALKAAATRRGGWRPYPITLGYGEGFYRACRRCAA